MLVNDINVRTGIEERRNGRPMHGPHPSLELFRGVHGFVRNYQR